MVEVFENEEEEEVYLCKLFGDDGRFVEFVNLTGRPVRLTSRLKLENFSNAAWYTTIIIPEGGKHVWRFLGNIYMNNNISFNRLLSYSFLLKSLSVGFNLIYCNFFCKAPTIRFLYEISSRGICTYFSRFLVLVTGTIQLG